MGSRHAWLLKNTDTIANMPATSNGRIEIERALKIAFTTVKLPRRNATQSRTLRKLRSVQQ